MEKWIVILTFILLAMAQGVEAVEKKSGKIQRSMEAEGWRWDGKENNYNSRTIFHYIDGAAELYLAYGFRNLTVRRLEKSGEPSIVAEIYEMGSSEDAFGVFSFENQDEEAGIGQGSEFGGGLLRFWKGKYFVSVYGEGEGAGIESAILKIGKSIAGTISDEGPKPKLLQYLPERPQGLVDKSIRYLRSHVLLNQRFFIAHQNILNLDPKTEALLATYLRDNHRLHLLLIRYTNREEAGAALKKFMKAYLPEAAGKDRLKTEDRKWTMARQKGEFLVIIFGALRETEGEELLERVEEKLPAR